MKLQILNSPNITSSSIIIMMMIISATFSAVGSISQLTVINASRPSDDRTCKISAPYIMVTVLSYKADETTTTPNQSHFQS